MAGPTEAAGHSLSHPLARRLPVAEAGPSRYFAVITLKALLSCLAVLLLAGCASEKGPPVFKTMKERDDAAFAMAAREAARYYVGRPESEILDPPDRDKTARLQLEPTPGARQIHKRSGQYWGEVLTSGPGSDAYVTDVTDVPITRYFRILREVDCDTMMSVHLINGKQIKANPGYITGRDRSMDPTYGCEQHFHARFKTGGDSAVAGADGVLMDKMTFEDHGQNSLWNFRMHVWMKAWTIQFVEPTDEEIRDRLSHRVYQSQSVEILQRRALAYWIEKHHATQYQKAMRASLPSPADHDHMLYGWNLGDIQLVRTLAAFADPANDGLWLTILRASTERNGRLPDSSAPVVSVAKRNDHVTVASNALACGGNTAYVPELKDIVRKAELLPYKRDAVRVLQTWGKTEGLVPREWEGLSAIGGAYRRWLEDALSKPSKFGCPFKVTYG